MSVLNERHNPLDIGSLRQHPLYNEHTSSLFKAANTQDAPIYASSTASASINGSPSSLEKQSDCSKLTSTTAIEGDTRPNYTIHPDRNISCVSGQSVDNSAHFTQTNVLHSFPGTPQVLTDGQHFQPISSNDRQLIGPQDLSKFLASNSFANGFMGSTFMGQCPSGDPSALLDLALRLRQQYPGTCTTIDPTGYTINSMPDNQRFTYVNGCNPIGEPPHLTYSALPSGESVCPNQSAGVDLLVSNLDYNIGPKEWRKILLTQLQTVVKNIQSIVIQSQSDGSNCAIIRVRNIDDARLAISQFHRKKIGYKRIQMNILTSNASSNPRNVRMDVITLLKSVAGNALQVCKFMELFEKRFGRPISLSELHKLRDIVEIRDQPAAQGGKVVLLNARMIRSELPEANAHKESLVCQIHCPEGSQEYMAVMESTILPSVQVPLNLFRKNVMVVLQEHGGSLPLLSFQLCYEALFGKLSTCKPPTKSSTSGANQTATDSDIPEQRDPIEKAVAQTDETESKARLFLVDGLEYSCSVPLEHLLTCASNIVISTEVNGVRRISFDPDQSREPSTCGTHQQSSTDLGHSKQQSTDLTPFNLPTAIHASTGPGGVLQDQLHQFSREVVDLLKHQPNCQIALSKFIPSYHHHFGKQCRVADYGYSKLHELITALPNVVHVMGSGNARILTLSHRVQVRRFTNEVIKILKSQSTKSCKIVDYPTLYKRVHRKDFRIADYGVCYLMDMLMEISDTTIELSQSGPDHVISLPKRVQTSEEKERTELFGIEVADLLRQSPRCRLPFNKFIPTYHHHFSRQCRVADYGFTKLIDLLEAVPNVVQFTEDHGEKYVALVRSRHLRIVGEQLLSMLESAPHKRIRLEDLPNAYLKAQGYPLCPEDFKFHTMKELLSSLPRIVQLDVALSGVPKDAGEVLIDELPEFETPINSSDPNEASTDPTSNIGDDSVKESTVGDKFDTVSSEYVCLADRTRVKHLCHRTLLILLDTPNGVLPTTTFIERFRCNFKDEPDMGLIRDELSDVIEFRDSPNPTMGEPSANRTNPPQDTGSMEVQVTKTEQSNELSHNVVSVQDAPSQITDPQTLGKYIGLQPLIIFARELRDLLRQNQGKILLVQLCAAYQRRFGLPLCPQRYNHLSLATLIQSVDFVAVTRGRGVRCTLVLCQDFLGKLSYRVAYNTKPLLESDAADSPSGQATEQLPSGTDEHRSLVDKTVVTSSMTQREIQPKATWSSNQTGSMMGANLQFSRGYQTHDMVERSSAASVPYSYYQVATPTHHPIPMVSQVANYTNAMGPGYGYYDYTSQTVPHNDGSFAPILYSSPQNTGYGPLTMVTDSTVQQHVNNCMLGPRVEALSGSVQYSNPIYPPHYSVPYTMNYTTAFSPIGSQIPPLLSTPGSHQLTTAHQSFPYNINSLDTWPTTSCQATLNPTRCTDLTSRTQYQLNELVERLGYNGSQYSMHRTSGSGSLTITPQRQCSGSHTGGIADISSANKNSGRRLEGGPNELQPQNPLTSLPMYPDSRRRSGASYPQTPDANSQINAESFTQLIDGRVNRETQQMSLKAGKNDCSGRQSGPTFTNSKIVESRSIPRDFIIHGNSQPTHYPPYLPHTFRLDNSTDFIQSYAMNALDASNLYTPMATQETVTDEQSVTSKQPADLSPSVCIPSPNGQHSQSTANSDVQFDQSGSFSTDESPGGFCLDGLLAELHLEESQQQQQHQEQHVRHLEMQQRHLQQQNPWSTMLSSRNAEQTLPMVPNQFTYF